MDFAVFINKDFRLHYITNNVKCPHFIFIAIQNSTSYPAILWFAPLVLVPAARFPALSTITIPEIQNH